MKKSIVVALMAGVLGGLAAHYISPPSAFAQAQSPATKEIRAQSFTLVDPSDRTVATFSIEQAPGRRRLSIRTPDQTVTDLSPMRIVLRDSAGRELWSAEPSDTAGIRPLTSK